jgi:type I restriction enzyme S subunit
MSQVIPEGWLNSKLEDVVDAIVGGGTPSKAISSYFQGDIPWMSVKDMNKNELVDTVDHISQEAVENSSTNVIPAGTPIVATRMSLGKIVTASFDSAINQDLKALFVNFNVEKPYLVYWYRSIGNLIESLGTGTTVKGIRLEVLKGLDFPLPPLAEQKVIADKLDELLAQVESTKARLDAIPAILKSFRQSVLAAAVSGKLTEEWRGVNPAILLDGPVTFNNNKFDEVEYGEIEFQIPNTWVAVRFGALVKLINGDRGKNYPNRNEYVETGLPFINTGHIEPNGSLSTERMNYITREKFNNLGGGKIIPGDLVYCLRGATMGKTAKVDNYAEGAIASSLVIVRPNRQLLTSFAYQFLISPQGKDLITRFDNGSAQPNLSAKSVSIYPFALPTIEEQTEIVRRVEELFAFADKVEAQVNAAQLRVNNLTQSILAKAFRGELTADWRSANPELISGENSAEALLKRIKAEREALATKKKPTNKLK